MGAPRQGYVYVLDSEGATREGWPLQMGDVQAQVAVADIDMDGRMCGPSFVRFPDHASHLCAMCRRTFFYMGGTLAAMSALPQCTAVGHRRAGGGHAAGCWLWKGHCHG